MSHASVNAAAVLAAVRVTAVLVALCGLVLHPVDLGAAEPPPPNIIFIMADDLGFGDVGCYGQQLIATPNIDRLAAEGVRFTQAYAGGPVCAASRAVLMTGLHNGHAAARDNIPHYHTYLQDDDVTLAEVLKQAEYRCGGVGKWSLGDAGTVGRATHQGFDMWLGYLNQDHAHYYFTEYLDDGDDRLELRGNTISHAHYSHDLLADRAIDFIRAAADDSRPFFLYTAFTVPHFSSRHEDPDGRAVPATDPYTEREWDSASIKLAAMIHRLDADVGRIVDAVDSVGLTSNTLIIFTSDNGGTDRVDQRFRNNGPMRGFKSTMYEGGIRVPFIARWPGVVPADRTSDEVIGFQDMLPTFAELAGATPPDDIDGITVVEALRGERLSNPHEFLYWDYGHCRARYDQSVRLGDWKGIRLGVGGPIELYDLEQDVGEQHDVAAGHPDVVERIAQIMRSAPTPSDRYPIGELYTGKPLWRPATGAE